MAFNFPTGTNSALSKIGSGVTITEEPSTMTVLNNPSHTGNDALTGERLPDDVIAGDLNDQAQKQAELAQHQAAIRQSQQALTDQNAVQDKKLDYQKYANMGSALQGMHNENAPAPQQQNSTYTPHSHPVVSVAAPEKEKNNMDGAMKLVGTVLAFL